MLNELELEAHFNRLGITDDGRQYIRRVRATPPQRRVESRGHRNTCVRFASERMGRVIQGESDTVEGAFIRELEFDLENVWEFWDQPQSIGVSITNRRGAFQRTNYTPDFLVIKPGEIDIVQCKPLPKLEELVVSNPRDWQCSNGIYCYRPASEEFERLGLRHTIWAPDCRSSIRSSNIDLLLAARRATCVIDLSLRKRIVRYLEEVGIASLAELLRDMDLRDATLVLKGIAEGWLFSPLDMYLLSRADDALLGIDQARFEQCHEALKLLRSTETTADMQVVPGVRLATVMLDRHHQLNGVKPIEVDQRTIRRWKSRLRLEKGDPRALLPLIHRRGNRNPRLSSEHERFVTDAIRASHSLPIALSIAASYSAYRGLFREAQLAGALSSHERPISRPTFTNRIRLTDGESLALARGGIRAGNAAAIPVDRSVMSAPITRPFHVAHVDHYLSDKHLVVRAFGDQRITARPWISLLRDEYDGSALALSIGFRAPSRVACARVLRDCGYRHGRLPEMIVVDAGTEFRSIFFESILAILSVHKKERPTSAPRFGGSLERDFCSLKTKVLWRQPGSTQPDQRGRSVSATHRGTRLAEQELLAFYIELDDIVFNHINRSIRGERIDAPSLCSRVGLDTFPFSGRRVSFDTSFLIATSIEAPKGKYLVDRTRGIRPLSTWHWHPSLAKLSSRSYVEVLCARCRQEVTSSFELSTLKRRDIRHK